MPYNIIFIDDSETIKKAVSAIMTDNPEFNMKTAGDVSIIPEITAGFKPDLIILNYSPVNSEIENNIRSLKGNHRLVNTPLLLIVPSDLQDSLRESFVKNGANGFIYRPFEKESFISKIKRSLGIDSTDKNGEKIYDISVFEVKGDAGSNAHGSTAAINNPSINSSNVKTAEDSAEKTDNKDENTASGNATDLNNAMENLFEGDKIFKKFEETGKTDEEDTGNEEAQNTEHFAATNLTAKDNYFEILDEKNLAKLNEIFKNDIKKLFEDIKPQIIENLKNILPEIAEKLIKEEIEKIKKL